MHLMAMPLKQALDWVFMHSEFYKESPGFEAWLRRNLPAGCVSDMERGWRAAIAENNEAFLARELAIQEALHVMGCMHRLGEGPQQTLGDLPQRARSLAMDLRNQSCSADQIRDAAQTLQAIGDVLSLIGGAASPAQVTVSTQHNAGEPKTQALRERFRLWADREFGPPPDPAIPQWERYASYYKAFCAGCE